MYHQITTKCNMTCEHCCMSCSKNHVGIDMPLYTFKASIVMRSMEEGITIGGGEPTMHPDFKEIIFASIETWQQNHPEDTCGNYRPWLATNASNANITRWLIDLATNTDYDFLENVFNEALDLGYQIDPSLSPLISMDISHDKYHDKRLVDPAILELARQRGIPFRNVEGTEVNAGFCDFGKRSDCVCESMQVKPDGSIFMCGCDDAPLIGSVHFGGIWTNPETGCIQDIDTDDEDHMRFIDSLRENYTLKDWTAEHQPLKREVKNIPIKNVA